MNFCNPSKLGRWCGALLSLVAAAHLMAQGTDATPTPAARLDQLDSTYSTNLRLYHAPVILDYLRELEKLRQSYAAKGSNDEAAQVQAEIDKAKKLSTSTGLLSYDPLKPAADPKGERRARSLRRLAKVHGSSVLTPSCWPPAVRSMPIPPRIP